MIPYSSLFFFYVLTLSLLPAVILGLLGKRTLLRIYGIILTPLYIYLVFSLNLKEFISVLAYFAYEILLIYLFLLICRNKKHLIIFWIFILLAICPLAAAKLSILPFIKLIPIPHLSGFGFLGISYLTFRVLQIIIEAHKGLLKRLNPLDLTYYILFFPTLSSGPIDRWRRFEKELHSPLSRQDYLNYLDDGIWKLVRGIGYKFVIGSLLFTQILEKIPKDSSWVNNLGYMYTYSFYLFFDFAGYSLIAIGVSYILGIKAPENFNLPFLSRNFKDFWNRWHMSLSFWFRDYIYNTFVFTALKHKWFKNKTTASYLGYTITMCTMGLWHGPYLHYIIYGLYHGILIILSDLLERKSNYRSLKDKAWFAALSIFVTFNLTCFGFLIFSGRLFI